MKKILGYILIVVIIGFVYKNWDRLTDLDKMLNNAVTETTKTNDVVSALIENNNKIINRLDTLSNNVKELESNVDKKIKNIRNDFKVEMETIKKELKEEFKTEETYTSWNYYRELDKLTDYYTNHCNISSDDVKLYNESLSYMTLTISDTSKNTYKINISLSHGSFNFKNGKSKIVGRFNNGFNDIIKTFEITQNTQRNNIAVINNSFEFINNVKKVNNFIIRTNMINEIDNIDYVFDSNKTLDETTRG